MTNERKETRKVTDGRIPEMFKTQDQRIIEVISRTIFDCHNFGYAQGVRVPQDLYLFGSYLENPREAKDIDLMAMFYGANQREDYDRAVNKFSILEDFNLDGFKSDYKVEKCDTRYGIFNHEFLFNPKNKIFERKLMPIHLCMITFDDFKQRNLQKRFELDDLGIKFLQEGKRK